MHVFYFRKTEIVEFYVMYLNFHQFTYILLFANYRFFIVANKYRSISHCYVCEETKYDITVGQCPPVSITDRAFVSSDLDIKLCRGGGR